MAKVGRPKNIQTPDEMWQAFQKYRDAVKSKPIRVKDWVGAVATEVAREKERPLTLEGFSVYCFEQGITSNIHDYFGNKNGSYVEFSHICRAIKEVIRQDQIEGGMAGIYNPSITQRLNGLVEKTQADDKREMTIKVKYEQDEPGKE